MDKATNDRTNFSARANQGSATVGLEHVGTRSTQWQLSLRLDDFEFCVSIKSPIVLSQIRTLLEHHDNSERTQVEIGQLGKSRLLLSRREPTEYPYLIQIQSSNGSWSKMLSESMANDMLTAIDVMISENDLRDHWQELENAAVGKGNTRFRFGLGTLISVVAVLSVIIGLSAQKWHVEYQRANRARAAMEDLRQLAAKWKLNFDSVFPDRGISRYQPEAMQRYPTEEAWPDVLGGPPTLYGMSFTPFGGDGRFSTNRPVIVEGPLTGSLATTQSTNVILEKGIASNGRYSGIGYAIVCCLGNVDGVMNFESYATAYVSGDINGQVFAESYFAMFVDGKLTGSIELDSYAKVYLMGGSTGNIKLNSSTIYIAGKYPQSDFGKVSGRGTVFLESSDLPAKEFVQGNTKFVVIGPVNAPSQTNSGK